jgi:hypothetical protein
MQEFNYHYYFSFVPLFLTIKQILSNMPFIYKTLFLIKQFLV